MPKPSVFPSDTAPYPVPTRGPMEVPIINHIVLVRKARGAEPPAPFETGPLVFQGGSDTFFRPTENIYLANEKWGCDFEAESALALDRRDLAHSKHDYPSLP